MTYESAEVASRAAEAAWIAAIHDRDAALEAYRACRAPRLSAEFEAVELAYIEARAAVTKAGRSIDAAAAMLARFPEPTPTPEPDHQAALDFGGRS